MKDYRIVINNDVLKIIGKDKIIKLTLLYREGIDMGSKLLKEVYTPKAREGYSIPQYGNPDYHEIVDQFYFEDMVIWGVKEQVDISSEDEEPQEEVYWYFDKGEL